MGCTPIKRTEVEDISELAVGTYKENYICSHSLWTQEPRAITSIPTTSDISQTKRGGILPALN